ncbi:MAG: hypothetical protein PHD76_10895 [Methylacidiphilales bacterium]|nr:hypothetical protein [Candidatus Methylacidiphilales bacterium]
MKSIPNYVIAPFLFASFIALIMACGQESSHPNTGEVAALNLLPESSIPSERGLNARAHDYYNTLAKNNYEKALKFMNPDIHKMSIMKEALVDWLLKIKMVDGMISGWHLVSCDQDRMSQGSKIDNKSIYLKIMFSIQKPSRFSKTQVKSMQGFVLYNQVYMDKWDYSISDNQWYVTPEWFCRMSADEIASAKGITFPIVDGKIIKYEDVFLKNR